MADQQGPNETDPQAVQSPPEFMKTENTTGEPKLPPVEVIESNDTQPG